MVDGHTVDGYTTVDGLLYQIRLFKHLPLMVMTLLEVTRAFQRGCQAAFASPGAWLKGQTTFVLVIPGHY